MQRSVNLGHHPLGLEADEAGGPAVARTLAQSGRPETVRVRCTASRCTPALHARSPRVAPRATDRSRLPVLVADVADRSGAITRPP